MLVIGIDCATDDAKVGLALGDYQARRASVREVILCSRKRSVAATVIEWLRKAAGPALLAIDAPLGWPEPMSRALTVHQAGDRLEATPSEMFRRTTDQFIQTKLGKTPLDVGADRIARTAHAALRLLADVRNQLALPIPLAWSSTFSGVACVEVYPAATLVAHGFRSTGYKKAEHVAERREMIGAVNGLIDLGSHNSLLEQSADALDAVVCLLAAKDFLEDRAMRPVNLALAKREGWIWATGRREA